MQKRGSRKTRTSKPQRLLGSTTFSAVVGFALAQLREQKGLRQGELAQKMEAPQSRLSRLESGSVLMTVEQLKLATEILGVGAHEVLAFAEQTAQRLVAEGIAVRIVHPDARASAARPLRRAELAAAVQLLTEWRR